MHAISVFIFFSFILSNKMSDNKILSSHIIACTSSPPYLHGKAPAPKIVETGNLFQVLRRWDAIHLLQFFLAVLGGFIYLFYSPFFHVIAYFTSKITPSTLRSSWCEDDGQSSGIISQRLCPKTGRTYVTRFFDSQRDVVDCSQMLVNSFNKDPFNVFLQPDIGSRHIYGQFLYRPFCESPCYDIIVEEWVEEEKIVGVLIYSQRQHHPFQEFIDNSKSISNTIRDILIRPRTAYLQLLVAVSMQNKFHQVCDSFGLSNVVYAKFLGVEKGFQGQGIGSSLLQAVTTHVNALSRYAYLESSNIANIPLYERYGFRVVEEWCITLECPPLYLMIRPIPSNDDSTSTSSPNSMTSTPDGSPMVTEIAMSETPGVELRCRR